MCVTKVKYLQKMEKQQVKECWHQNVTACHDTYMTEFRPIQEKVCDENFWKACKITFRDESTFEIWRHFCQIQYYPEKWNPPCIVERLIIQAKKMLRAKV